MMVELDSEFLPEVWTLYSIGVVVIFLRFACRIRTVGIRGFQGDDYFSLLTLLFFTLDSIAVHFVYHTGTNIEAVQGIRELTPKEIIEYEYGSKFQFASWYAYTTVIWTMKATMVYFFARLTEDLIQHKYIKWLGMMCGITYLAVILTITFGCYPTRKNWQVMPNPGGACTLNLQNFIVTAVLNVATDILILAIPISILRRLRVPLLRKIIISVLLCGGVFVIAAAIIHVAITLGSRPSALSINRWSVRETIVSLIAINLPVLRPMFNRSFWTKGGASLQRVPGGRRGRSGVQEHWMEDNNKAYHVAQGDSGTRSATLMSSSTCPSKSLKGQSSWDRDLEAGIINGAGGNTISKVEAAYYRIPSSTVDDWFDDPSALPYPQTSAPDASFEVARNDSQTRIASGPKVSHSVIGGEGNLLRTKSSATSLGSQVGTSSDGDEILIFQGTSTQPREASWEVFRETTFSVDRHSLGGSPVEESAWMRGGEGGIDGRSGHRPRPSR